VATCIVAVRYRDFRISRMVFGSLCILLAKVICSVEESAEKHGEMKGSWPFPDFLLLLLRGSKEAHPTTEVVGCGGFRLQSLTYSLRCPTQEQAGLESNSLACVFYRSLENSQKLVPGYCTLNAVDKFRVAEDTHLAGFFG
jgi:hypothetical protein